MQAIEKLLHGASYLTSVHKPSQLPPDEGIEVAVAGRSNSGKSSLINGLCRRKALARTSRTPGRTQQLVLFELDPARRLVDLPGYGYAAVGADLRRHWQGLIQGYLESRQALVGLIIVMDIRHPLKLHDIELIEFANQAGLALHLVLTKADKLGHGRRQQALAGVRQACADQVGVQVFSATTGLGLAELQARLAAWFGLTSSQPGAAG